MSINQQQFSDSFMLLLQEGYLISSCLTNGLTELRVANIHNKGAFYSALFNLSIGIERLLKSILIMDHMLNNDLAVPSKKELKKRGHNITELYESVVNIAGSKGMKIHNVASLDETTKEILELLSDFAQTTRYHNLDALSSSSEGKDPLIHWNEIIFKILKDDVSEYQIKKILVQSDMATNAIDDVTHTIMQGLDKQAITTWEAFALPELHDQATKHAVLKIIIFLSPIRVLISDISHEAYKFPTPPFPQMQEFFEWLWDNRQYVLRKKRWP